jgi:hypothetical protein
MKHRDEPLISPAQWAALTCPGGRGQIGGHYPIRVWCLLGTCALCAVALFLSGHRMTPLSAADRSMVDPFDADLFMPLRHAAWVDRREPSFRLSR